MARRYDESKTNYSTGALTRYVRGSDQVLVAWAPTKSVSSFVARKRAPSGGKATPEMEKPFLTQAISIMHPQGAMRWHGVGGVDYGLVGSMTSSRCCKSSASGGGLYWTGQLEWPLRRDSSDAILYTGMPSDIKSNVDLLSQAEVKSLNGLRGRARHDSDVDLGLFWAERRETASLFRDGSVGLLNLARAIAQKDYGRSARILKDVFGVRASAKAEARRMARLEKWLKWEAKRTGKTANRTLKGLEDAVLGYNLGLSPLVGDLQKAHQRLLTGDLEASTVVKSIGRHSSNLQDKVSRTCPTCGRTRISASISRMVGYTVTFRARPRKTDLSKLARAGLTNPGSLAYQATTLTFVIDYFANFGPYLKALDIPLMFEYVDGSYTHRVIQNLTWMAESHGGRKAKGMSAINHTQRKVYTSFPVPIPPLSLREDALNFRQMVNTGLLAIKQLRSLLKR